MMRSTAMRLTFLFFVLGFAWQSFAEPRGRPFARIAALLGEDRAQAIVDFGRDDISPVTEADLLLSPDGRGLRIQPTHHYYPGACCEEYGCTHFGGSGCFWQCDVDNAECQCACANIYYPNNPFLQGLCLAECVDIQNACYEACSG